MHPAQIGVMPLGTLCKQNEGNLQRKKGRKKASHHLNYSFVPDKTFRLSLIKLKSTRKTSLYTLGVRGMYTFIITLLYIIYAMTIL